MLLPAKQLQPGYRIFDRVSQRLATVTVVGNHSFGYRIDHWTGFVTAPIDDQVIPVVSLGGVG